jgi:hypothetical protein
MIPVFVSQIVSWIPVKKVKALLGHTRVTAANISAAQQLASACWNAMKDSYLIQKETNVVQTIRWSVMW